jgi:hypothetical protein
MIRKRRADWLKVGDLEEELGVSLSEQALAARVKAAARSASARPARKSTGPRYVTLGHLAGLSGMMGFVMVILTIITHVVVHTQTAGMGYLVAAIFLFMFAAIGSGVAKSARDEYRLAPVTPDAAPSDPFQQTLVTGRPSYPIPPAFALRQPARQMTPQQSDPRLRPGNPRDWTPQWNDPENPR